MQVSNKLNALDISWSRFNLALSKRTHIMGVLNRTPDSFSDSGRFMKEEDAVERVLEMASQGADIIDIGGESTRPGAEPVPVNVELDRTIPIIKKTARKINLPISIDTYKPEVALEALKNGAAIINDITGLQSNPRMAEVARDFDVPVVIMHMKGTPQTMQINPSYDSLIDDILTSLNKSVELAKKAGVDENKLIIDPGIGFGKTVQHNLEILNNLELLKGLNRPLLIGVSRKSFIAETLKANRINEKDIEAGGRLMGTACACTISILKGANILRVHDVKKITQVARIADAIRMS